MIYYPYPIYPTYTTQIQPLYRLQSMQTSNTTTTIIAAGLLLGVGYLLYKFAWIPYSIRNERDSCIKSCYARAEKREEEEAGIGTQSSP